MHYGKARDCITNGGKMYRTGWVAVDRFVRLRKTIDASFALERATNDGSFRPYYPSAEDIRGTDWEAFNERAPGFALTAQAPI